MAPPTIPPTAIPSSTIPRTVLSTSTTLDATPPLNSTIPTTPPPNSTTSTTSGSQTGLQRGSLAISAIILFIAIYVIVKALVMLPTNLLATRYAIVKEFQEHIAKVMEDVEQTQSHNLGISRRGLELATKCIIQITATWNEIGASTFPYYNRRVHKLMMGVFRCMWDFHDELRGSDAILALNDPADPSAMVDHAIASYAKQWQVVIERARRLFRVYMAAKDGFPDAASGLEVAYKCLNDALSLHLEGGGVVEPNHHIDESMKMVVYAESWRFRQTLKTVIAAEVPGLKPLFPDEPTGSDQEAQQIGNAIKLWTDFGSYLHGSIPDSDIQVPFAHPIIASTVRSFYRGQWTDTHTHGQYMVKGVVPKPLIALVGSVYRNTLDEWLSGQRLPVALEREVYKPVYDTILDAIAHVHRHSVDGPRLRTRLADWAKPETPAGAYVAQIPTEIHLNLSPLL